MTMQLLFADRAPMTLTPDMPQEGITATLTVTEAGVHTVTLTTDRVGISPEALEVSIPLPADLLTPIDDLYIYDDSAHTNDFTELFRYADHRTRLVEQLAVFRNRTSGRTYLAGLLTLHRFWSGIFLREDSTVFRFELEGRALIPGETYQMERFMLTEDPRTDAGAPLSLLESYADAVAALNHAVPAKEIPVGFCSWSCYFGAVNEEKLRRAADAQVAHSQGYASLIQIDDGWQKDGSFCGTYVLDDEKFPAGLASTSAYVREWGMTFGLWLAPLLLDEHSSHYENLRDMAMPAVTLGDRYHPFNLGDPRFHEHLRTTFRRMADEYGARYFKLDFLASAIRYFNGQGKFVRFESGYCVELLRSVLMTIRETVGDDVFLLACGAQTLIGAGICNGARTSADIIWGKNKHNPSYWSIMKRCLSTVGRRYFYHNKVYTNDPDGVVLRDFDQGDGFNCTYSEAELWSVAVAMSGGLVLSNDELENLSPARRRLFTRLLPPMGRAARPVDYFEVPYPTAYVLDVDADTKFLALYHFGDEMVDLDFDLARIGMKGAYATDCLARTRLGAVDILHVSNADPHSAALFLISHDEERGEIGEGTNIFLGITLPKGDPV